MAINKSLLTFEEDTHTYKYDGKIVISVTQVLSGLTDYSNVPKKYMDKAIDRGDKVHFAIELYNKFGAIEIEKEYKPRFDQFLKFKDDFKFKALHNELLLYSKEYNYAGTVDCVGQISLPTGIQTLPIDYKTTSEYKYDYVGLQLSGYRQLLRENNIQADIGMLLWLQDTKHKPLIYTSEQLDNYFEHFKTLLQAKKIIRYYGGK